MPAERTTDPVTPEEDIPAEEIHEGGLRRKLKQRKLTLNQATNCGMGPYLRPRAR